MPVIDLGEVYATDKALRIAQEEKKPLSLVKIRREQFFPLQYGYEIRFPVNETTVKIITGTGGEITWWQHSLELLVSLGVLIGTGFIGSRFDPIFGAIWMLISVMAFSVSKNLRFRLFDRPPEMRYTTYVKSDEFAQYFQPDMPDVAQA